ncbi:MAG: cation acetate symporter [Neisseriaceae bacterium]|nr:cation acetate symporter [Neisseriaceae bacterium]MBP6862813.1 cation acetate symporter [Neisseriaceae bacterium]
MNKPKPMGRASAFYLADRSIGAWQNAWALAGDYLSAAAFLGAVALYYSAGLDSLYYAVATLLGWPLLLILFADRLRAGGAYTLTGVLQQRFGSVRLQALSALTSLFVSVFYLLVQLIGAGKLLSLLFGWGYGSALMAVCGLTFALVFLGGMKATTLVQSIKAVCLFACAFVLVGLVWRAFDFQLPRLWQAVAQQRPAALLPSMALSDPIEQVSLVLGLVLGLLGLPHVLMRFFTVKNPQAAIRSAAYAGALIGLFFSLNVIVGFGALVLLDGQTLSGGGNMVLLHLANQLGGAGMQWALSVVVFLTILAVMAGLVMAASASLNQDILPLLFGHQVHRPLWAKGGIVLLLVLGGLLAWLFEDFNLAFLFGLAFAWAASAHFPVLWAQFFMPSFNERAAFYGLLCGAVVSTVLIVASPTVWVGVLGFETALFPWSNPTLFALPCSFLVIVGLCMRTSK